MPDTLFQGIFDTQLTAVIAPEQFLLCVGASLVIGLVLYLASSGQRRGATQDELREGVFHGMEERKHQA